MSASLVGSEMCIRDSFRLPGYLSKVGIRDIKSALSNDIFRQEMLHVYEQKSQSRDELVAEARRTMLELADQMKHSICEHP